MALLWVSLSNWPPFKPKLHKQWDIFQDFQTLCLHCQKSNKSVLMKIHPKKKPLYLIQQYKEANDVLHWQTTAMYPTDSNTADT